LLLGTAAVLTVAGFAGTALAPSLLTYHPLLLIALSPIGRHLVLAATLAPMLPLVLVATARRMLSSALGYGFGHAYGDDGLHFVRARYPRMSGALAMLERMFERAAPLVLFLAPGPLLCALAGATRMPLWLFLPLTAGGHLMWASLTYRLGEALSTWIAPITEFLRSNVAPTTLGCAALVTAYALLRRRRLRKQALQPSLAKLPVQPIALTPPPSDG
jgi:membrane protein DedA with SNARE-associated domain